MARTDSFKTQHREMQEIVTQITARLNPSILPDHADEVRKLLSTLSGKLSVHLAMEDKSLYPTMLNSGNEEAKQTAENFMTEMGSLAATFKEYVQKWPSAATIKENTAEFCTQTKAIFAALSARIDREEHSLYPLADKL